MNWKSAGTQPCFTLVHKGKLTEWMELQALFQVTRESEARGDGRKPSQGFDSQGSPFRTAAVLSPLPASWGAPTRILALGLGR